MSRYGSGESQALNHLSRLTPACARRSRRSRWRQHCPGCRSDGSNAHGKGNRVDLDANELHWNKYDEQVRVSAGDTRPRIAQAGRGNWKVARMLTCIFGASIACLRSKHQLNDFRNYKSPKADRTIACMLEVQNQVSRVFWGVPVLDTHPHEAINRNPLWESCQLQ